MTNTDASHDSGMAAIAAALQVRIAPVTRAPSYRAAVAGVAALMVLLPVLYVALLVLVLVAVYLHLTLNTWLFGVSGLRSSLLATLIYLSPAIAGLMLTVVMARPLFAKRPRAVAPVTVRREDEPQLYAFVDGLCDAIGARRPVAIQLTDQVNAAAALVSSVFNPFRHDLHLVIGLPLVAGLTLRQFGGVLAHEFGHFTQGTGMRLGGIIRSINDWLAFVVFYRDQWDARLKQDWGQWARQYQWVLMLGEGLVWTTRKIMTMLMELGIAVSCRMSREMEFDADRHESRFSGSRVFSETFARLAELHAARQAATAALSVAYRDGVRVDDLFALTMHHDRTMRQEDRDALHHERLARVTGRFDTHPSDADRLAQVQQESEDGAFLLEASASVLFRDFAATCRAETAAFYHWQVGDAVQALRVQTADDLIAQGERRQQETGAAVRVLPGRPLIGDPLPLPAILPSTNTALAELRAEAARLAADLPSRTSAIDAIQKRVFHSWDIDRQAIVAERLLKAGFTVHADTFAEPMTSDREIELVRLRNERAAAQARQQLSDLLALYAERLVASLRMLTHPDIGDRLPDATRLRAEADRLLAAMTHHALHTPVCDRAFLMRLRIQDWWHQLAGREHDAVLLEELAQVTREGLALLSEARTALQQRPYPFEHGHHAKTLAQVLVAELPPHPDASAVHGALQQLSDEGIRLGERIIGQLCAIVEIVEAAISAPEAALAPAPGPQ